jgi:hypothetical protein
VAVEIVAVGGVHTGADPDARVGQLHRVLGYVAAELGQGATGDRDTLIQTERIGARELPLLEPVREQVVVVIAGDHDQPRPAGRFGKLGEEGARDRERLAERPVAELDHVAQENHLVGCLQRGP